MRRRDFITLVGGSAVWPIGVGAQQAMPVIGYLGSENSDRYATRLTAFRQGLGAMGFDEGRNVAIEFVWADGQPDRLPALAADLVRRRVTVIAAPGSAAAGLAAKAATTTIPVVFETGLDPVQAGLVKSLNRPEGNVTGVTSLNSAVTPKGLELLASIGVTIEVPTANTNSEIDAAFESLAQKHVDALVVSPDNLFSNRRVQLITLSSRHAVPTIYSFREDVEAGGLMSYGADIPGEYRDVGIYVGRILKGEKPAELPVVQPTKFEFVVNQQTAKTLGLRIPPALLTAADKVIE
jgi:putative ABC transport system substrate-binding protein